MGDFAGGGVFENHLLVAIFTLFFFRYDFLGGQLMDSFDNDFAVEKRAAIVFVGWGYCFFTGEGHGGVIERPELLQIIDHLTIIDDLLDIAIGGGDFAAFDQLGHFLVGEVIAFNASTVMDGADDGFLLKLFFVGRN